MPTVFISDLHLDAGRPTAIHQFVGFARDEATRASALYILGDLFEAWIGDDDTDPSSTEVVDVLSEVSAAGVPCFFMHGNRDFLVGKRFEAATGCQLIEDPKVVQIEGQQVLLTHGDLLCTDDESYQALRAIVRNPNWQRDFLAKSLEERRAIAEDLRKKSRAETAAKPEDIMDVNQGAVEDMMRKHGVTLLLHGHTHRPGVHRFTLDGQDATRIVLGAWHEQGSVVRWDTEGFRLDTLPR